MREKIVHPENGKGKLKKKYTSAGNFINFFFNLPMPFSTTILNVRHVFLQCWKVKLESISDKGQRQVREILSSSQRRGRVTFYQQV